ncbi:Uncharacterized protein OBRU01_10113, partial [Operophtera brumata]
MAAKLSRNNKDKCSTNLRIAQPVLLGKLVEYYSPEQHNIQQNEAYMYAGGVVLCSALNVFVVHPYMMAILHMGMKFRVACCSLIYRKTALGETTVGQVVNLLSNDVNRFDVAIIFLHYLWIGPVATVIITVPRQADIGPATEDGVANGRASASHERDPLGHTSHQDVH